MRSAFNLQSFPLLLGQAPVIGYLQNHGQHAFSKPARKLIGVCLRVFNDIMEKGSDNQPDISNASDPPEQVRHFNRVIDVRG
jgi:hypothetical protein